MKPWEEYQQPAAAGPWDDYAEKPASQPERTIESLITGKAPVNKNRQRGVELPSGLQGGMAALQGPTFGFADEIAGAASAGGQLLTGDTNVRDNYVATRDMYRGAVDDAQQRNPILTGATQVAASAPLLLLTRGAGAVPGAAPVAANTARMTMPVAAMTAGKSGAIYGGTAGLGNSEADTLAGNLIDAGTGAVSSAVFGAASVPVGRAMGAAGSGVMARIREASANSYAKQKVAEALIRDARGAIPQRSASGGITQASAKLGKLGDDAMVVDAGGQNARALLDVVASTPGRTKDAAERAIRERMAGRGGRIGAAAEGALGTQNAAYVGSLEAFDEARKAAAAPLYEKAFKESGSVIIPKELLARESVAAAYRKAQASAKEAGFRLPDMDPRAVQPIPPLSLRQADFLKKAMDDVLYLGKMPESNVGKNQMGLMKATRAELVSAIDGQAGPTYAAARNAWAGPSSSMEAAELGRSILKEDALAIPDLTRGMSTSEMDAFRIGVTQAVKDKAGTQSGQTQLLKMWANPGTRDKLKAVFGNDFRKFSAAIMGEERKKGLESVGRGSQTAARQFGAEDMDMSAVLDAGQAAGSAIRGNPMGMWNMVRRVQTPEPVRDEMGRLLMQRGPQAGNALNDLMQYADDVNRARAARAAGFGLFFGSQVPGLIVSP